MRPEYNTSTLANCDDFLKRVFASEKLQLMELLLGDGDVNFLLNEEGETPLSVAAKTGNVRAVQLLIARGANPMKLRFRLEDGSPTMAEDPFAEAGANAAILTILHHAKEEIEKQNAEGAGTTGKRRRDFGEAVPGGSGASAEGASTTAGSGSTEVSATTTGKPFATPLSSKGKGKSH